MLSAKDITNLFLYGQRSTPVDLSEDKLIRPLSAEGSVDIDLQEFMKNGAGCFAIGSQFESMADHPITRCAKDSDLRSYLHNSSVDDPLHQRYESRHRLLDNALETSNQDEFLDGFGIVRISKSLIFFWA